MALDFLLKGVRMIHYKGIQLSFRAARSPYEAFGRLSISKLKTLSNRLGIPHVGDLFRGFSDTGFSIRVPDEPFPIYGIKVNRVTAADLLMEANCCSSLYKLSQRYTIHGSNCYSSLNTDSDITLSYIAKKLPRGYDIPSFLDELEGRSERTGKVTMSRMAEGYCYSGIPKEVLIAMWIIRRMGPSVPDAKPMYCGDILDGDTFNTYIHTLERCAADIGMTLKAFVSAIEKDELVLTVSDRIDAASDNSRESLVNRMLDAAGCNDRGEFFSLVPDAMRKAVKYFMSSNERSMQTSTILQALSFTDLTLSDIIA